MLHAWRRSNNYIFIVFSLTQPGLEPTIYRTQSMHANYRISTSNSNKVEFRIPHHRQQWHSTNKALNKCLYNHYGKLYISIILITINRKTFLRRNYACPISIPWFHFESGDGGLRYEKMSTDILL